MTFGDHAFRNRPQILTAKKNVAKVLLNIVFGKTHQKYALQWGTIYIYIYVIPGQRRRIWARYMGTIYIYVCDSRSASSNMGALYGHIYVSVFFFLFFYSLCLIVKVILERRRIDFLLHVLYIYTCGQTPLKYGR